MSLCAIALALPKFSNPVVAMMVLIVLMDTAARNVASKLGWRDWAAGLTDENVASEAAYQDLKGNPHTTQWWKIVLHVVNHGTHHRGQVSGFLRTMGHLPPPLDLMAYYRTLS